MIREGLAPWRSDDLSAPLGQNRTQELRRCRCRRDRRAASRGALGLSRRVCAAGRCASTIRSAASRSRVVAARAPPLRAAEDRRPRRPRAARARRSDRCRPRPPAPAALPPTSDRRSGTQDRHHHRRLDRQAPGSRDPARDASDELAAKPARSAPARDLASRPNPEGRAGRHARRRWLMPAPVKPRGARRMRRASRS